MGDIQVTWRCLDDVLSSLQNIKFRVELATREATEASGRQLQSDARDNFHGSHAPGFWHVGAEAPNRVTGQLQASILVGPVVGYGAGIYRTRVGPTAIYGRLIELGGHVTPQERKYLSWFDAQMGVRRFVKSVDVPPHPYFIPARLRLPPRMQRIFKLAWGSAWTSVDATHAANRLY